MEGERTGEKNEEHVEAAGRRSMRGLCWAEKSGTHPAVYWVVFLLLAVAEIAAAAWILVPYFRWIRPWEKEKKWRWAFLGVLAAAAVVAVGFVVGPVVVLAGLRDAWDVGNDVFCASAMTVLLVALSAEVWAKGKVDKDIRRREVEGDAAEDDWTIISENTTEPPEAVLRFGEPVPENLARLRRFLAGMECRPRGNDDPPRPLCGWKETTCRGTLDDVMDELAADLADDWKDNAERFKDTPARFEHLAAWSEPCPGLLAVYTRIYADPGIDFGSVLYARGVQRTGENTYCFWKEYCLTPEEQSRLERRHWLLVWTSRAGLGAVLALAAAALAAWLAKAS